MLASILLLGGCKEEELDPELTKKLWAKTVEVVGIDAATPLPEMMMMDEDLYKKIILMDCENGDDSEVERQECREDLRKLEDSVLQKTGKNYPYRYGGAVLADRRILSEKCENYSDDERRKQCEADKFQKRNSNVHARAFLSQNYLEFYYLKIRSFLSGYDGYYARYKIPFTYNEKESYFVYIQAHEMLHIAIYLKIAVDGKLISIDDHHRLMKDKYMGPLLDMISDHYGIDRNGIHRELAMKSLDAGISSDEASKRIKERLTDPSPKGESESLVLPCGLEIHLH